VLDYLTDSHTIHVTEGHHVEDDFVTPFLNFMNRVTQEVGDENFRFIRGGTDGAGGKPDFRFQRQVGGAWRNTCLVEAKSHAQSLSNMIQNRLLNNQQVYRYLQQCPNVLVTNHRQFSLLHARPEQWPAANEAEHQFATSADDFWSMAQTPPSQEICNTQFQEFVNWIREHILVLQPQGNTTKSHLRYAMLNLYSGIKEWLRSIEQSDEDQPWAYAEIMRHVQHTGIGSNETHRISIAAQIRVMGLVLLRCRLNPPQFRLQYGNHQTHIASGTMRTIYSQYIVHEEEIGLNDDVEYLADCLIHCTGYDFNDTVAMERLYLKFLDFAEPGWRRRYGFTMTPRRIIAYMVSLSHERLIEQGEGFDTGANHQQGILRDTKTAGRARIVDMATGTGRYYIEVLRFIFIRTREISGLAAAQEKVRRAIGLAANDFHLAARVHAFDIQPACLMMTYFSLELFLDENGISGEGLSPSILLTDSLEGWLEGDAIQFGLPPIKQGSVNVLIANPPWAGYGTEDSPQDRVRLSELLRPWKQVSQTRYSVLNPPRNLPATKANPADAFIRVAAMKAQYQHENFEGSERPCVACFITPQHFADRGPLYGGRFQLSQGFDVTVDLLGGDMRGGGHQGGNVFTGLDATPVANFISCFTVSEVPRFRRRLHFTGSSEDKLELLRRNSENIGGIQWEDMVPEEESLLKYYGTEEDQPSWPTIEQIQLFHTQGPQEQRGGTLMHPYRDTLEGNVRNGIYVEWGDAIANAPRLWLGRFNQGEWRAYARFNPEATFESLNQIGFQEDWIRLGTYYPFNHIHIYLPGLEDFSRLWNEPRRPAILHSNNGGMILVPSIESKDTDSRVAYAPNMPLSSHSVFENAWAFPLTVIMNTPDHHLELRHGDGVLRPHHVAEERELRDLLDLTSIQGVGPALARRIEEAGFENTLELANTQMDAQAIADAINNTEGRDLDADRVQLMLDGLDGRPERVEELQEQINQEVHDEEVPNLSAAVTTLLENHGYEVDLNLSRDVWFHILAVMSSPSYNNEPFVELPGGKENRIPLPSDQNILTHSATLGRVVAQLHALGDLPESENDRVQAILGFIDNSGFRFADITDADRTEANIVEAGIRLSEIHSKATNISHPRYQYDGDPSDIDGEADYITVIADSLETSTEEVCNILGYQTVDIMLNENIVLRGIPRTVCDLTIGTYRVLGQWLAWRCSRKVVQQPIPGIHEELRILIRHLMHLLLLSPILNQNYELIEEDAIEYEHPNLAEE